MFQPQLPDIWEKLSDSTSLMSSNHLGDRSDVGSHDNLPPHLHVDPQLRSECFHFHKRIKTQLESKYCCSQVGAIHVSGPGNAKELWDGISGLVSFENMFFLNLILSLATTPHSKVFAVTF